MVIASLSATEALSRVGLRIAYLDLKGGLTAHHRAVVPTRNGSIGATASRDQHQQDEDGRADVQPKAPVPVRGVTSDREKVHERQCPQGVDGEMDTAPHPQRE